MKVGDLVKQPQAAWKQDKGYGIIVDISPLTFTGSKQVCYGVHWFGRGCQMWEYDTSLEVISESR